MCKIFILFICIKIIGYVCMIWCNKWKFGNIIVSNNKKEVDFIWYCNLINRCKWNKYINIDVIISGEELYDNL